MNESIVWLMLAVMTLPVVYTLVAYWKTPKAERDAINNALAEHNTDWES